MDPTNVCSVRALRKGGKQGQWDRERINAANQDTPKKKDEEGNLFSEEFKRTRRGGHLSLSRQKIRGTETRTSTRRERK